MMHAYVVLPDLPEKRKPIPAPSRRDPRPAP
jgi:hypothetical protein